MKETFGVYGNALTRWKTEFLPSCPHSELIIWIGVLRAVSARRPEWTYAYPDDEALHP
jgi:hypothetical protein